MEWVCLEEGYGQKDLEKRKVLTLDWKSEEKTDDWWEWWVDKEEVPVIGIDELESRRLVSGWWRKAGSWFQRLGEAYWK